MIKTAYIKHEPGHKNSKGESAEWVIRDHDGGKILSSHKTEEEAKKHLQHMHAFSAEESIFSKIASIEDLVRFAEDSTSKMMIKDVHSNEPFGYITLNELYDPQSQSFTTEITEVEIFEDTENIKSELQQLPPMPWRDLRDSISAILASSEAYLSAV